ncbi:MAG: ATP-binding protein [Bacteroidetes bacterium]|nr:ATP-binding protein [Bacteroidota bacterium]HET6245905.1 ATP-binding protein [Bacteroidia bacterium]
MNLPLDIEIFADTLMMESILQNLISNAIKFTPDGGYVSIKVKVKEDEEGLIEIRVKDSGIGMTEEIRKSIFDERKTITTQGTRKEEGSGVGVKLVKEFVRKQGGSLWVESETRRRKLLRFFCTSGKRKDKFPKDKIFRFLIKDGLISMLSGRSCMNTSRSRLRSILAIIPLLNSILPLIYRTI